MSGTCKREQVAVWKCRQRKAQIKLERRPCGKCARPFVSNGVTRKFKYCENCRVASCKYCGGKVGTRGRVCDKCRRCILCAVPLEKGRVCKNCQRRRHGAKHNELRRQRSIARGVHKDRVCRHCLLTKPSQNFATRQLGTYRKYCDDAVCVELERKRAAKQKRGKRYLERQKVQYKRWKDRQKQQELERLERLSPGFVDCSQLIKRINEIASIAPHQGHPVLLYGDTISSSDLRSILDCTPDNLRNWMKKGFRLTPIARLGKGSPCRFARQEVIDFLNATLSSSDGEHPHLKHRYSRRSRKSRFSQERLAKFANALAFLNALGDGSRLINNQSQPIGENECIKTRQNCAMA